MTGQDCFDLINLWKEKSYLSKFELVYDPCIYAEALDIFSHDYLRWYPNDNGIDVDKLILTPQLHAILTYRIARLFFLGKEAGCGMGQKDIFEYRPNDRFVRALLFCGNRVGIEDKSWNRSCGRCTVSYR